jgi:hypothetical protein
MSADAELTKIRGEAPEKHPTIRVLAAAAEHNDCPFSRLALATRTDLDRLAEGTYFAVDFGQDPQAFQRGRTFERLVKDKDYAALIQLLREKASFPTGDVRIRDLCSGFAPNEKGLMLRAAETKQLLRKIVQKAADAPNIVDGAVLTCRIAGRTAYFEADGLAAASGGKIHVAEIKSFPLTDGRCDNDKLGTACEQAAWYAMLCRRTLVELKLSPEAVADDGFIIVARGLGLAPTLLHQSLSARIRRAANLLQSIPSGEDVVAVAKDLAFPAADAAPHERVERLEQMMDQVGTRYRPECLQNCGMARLCRGRTQESGLVDLCGSPMTRLLPGVRTLSRAAELAGGAKPAPTEKYAAAELQRAQLVYQRILKDRRL